MSTTRRAFLRSAALGAFALPSLGTLVRAGVLQFDRVFFDVRRPYALAFGDTARQLGAHTQPICGDLDDPCYEDLSRRWRKSKTPVAGFTDFRVLFLLQGMAADAGLRPVLRMLHRSRGASTAHQVQSSCAAARVVMGLSSRDADGMARPADVRSTDLHAVDSRALVTWVIA